MGNLTVFSKSTRVVTLRDCVLKKFEDNTFMLSRICNTYHMVRKEENVDCCKMSINVW